MISLDIVLFILTITGSIAFMISGALAGARAHMDIGGMIVLSMVTGVSGGTIRGLLLHQPIFWMQQNWYIYLAIIVAVFTFIAYQFIVSKKSVLIIIDVFDAFGLAAFMATGVSSALAAHQTPIVAIVIGAITCVGGGVVRDMLCNQVPIIFQEGLYMTPVVIGSGSYIAINHYLGDFWAVIVSSVILLLIRFLAIGLSLKAPKIVQN
jgi:uncharacterized membrane protein YeiH